jgi:hypothetical protein
MSKGNCGGRMKVSFIRIGLPNGSVAGLIAVGLALIQTASAAHLKPHCRGLMLRDFSGPATIPFVDHAVVQVKWKDLEAVDQKFDGPGWEQIERARKSGMKLRLRIFAGIHSPAFVIGMGGPGLSAPEHNIDCSKTGGIAVWNRHDQKGGRIPRFWLPEVLDQYEQLMTEVARRYDEAPEILEVVASGCMTVYAEPFYRAHGEAGTNRRLFEAGLTLEKDRAAHQRVIEIHHRLFQRTRTSLAVNAWDVIDDSPKHHHASFEPTHEFVTWARELMGEKLVLQNNGTGVEANPDRGTPHNNHFAFLKSVSGPKGFQTRTFARLGGTAEGVWQTLDTALRMKANFVELPSGFQRLDLERLKQYDQQLEANE